MPASIRRGLETKMKITCNEKFHFVHNGREEFDLGPIPVEVSNEAYDHLISIHGTAKFHIVDSVPKESLEESSEKESEDTSLESSEESEAIDSKTKEIINKRDALHHKKNAS